MKTENRFTWDDEVTGSGLEEKVFIRELTRGLILLDGPVHILVPSAWRPAASCQRNSPALGVVKTGSGPGLPE